MPWILKSRLLSLAGTTVLYGTGATSSTVPRDAGKILTFVDAHPETAFLFLSLNPEDPSGLFPDRANLLVFNVGRALGSDMTWKGLTAGGHKNLARVIDAILQKSKDKLLHSL
jgi:hypothetical protein